MLRLAPIAVEPLELQLDEHTGASLSGMRSGVEHVRDARTLPRLRAPVAMDLVPAVP